MSELYFKDLIIVVTGVCASGKSALIKNLRELGFDARHVAQEHSSAHQLWKHPNPDFLVVLDCSYDTAKKRRDIYWTKERIDNQRKCLEDAISCCDVYLNTDELSEAEVLDIVLQKIKEKFGA
jgi:thymidylate kinase